MSVLLAVAAVLTLEMEGCDAPVLGLESAPAPARLGLDTPPRPPTGTPARGPRQRECGAPGLPACPLQAWMRSTLQAYMTSGGLQESERIADALSKLADAAPPPYLRWKAIASRGAEAARRHDRFAVEQSCGTCHELYRGAFRAQMGARRIF
jgi:hypothetical protein